MACDESGCPEPTEVSGNISGNWTLEGSPYLVVNNLVLQPTDTLLIDPGVEVHFDGNYRVDIFGLFLADGNPSDSIIFTRHGDVNWMSLNFADDSNDDSVLEYCIIGYASESGYDAVFQDAIIIRIISKVQAHPVYISMSGEDYGIGRIAIS
jgi:hypothetical protein